VCSAPIAAQFVGGGVGVHNGHLHVHENQTEQLRRGQFDRDVPIADAGHHRAGMTHLHAYQPQMDVSVLEQKDALGGGGVVVLGALSFDF
jgi:hypothetical protein